MLLYILMFAVPFFFSLVHIMVRRPLSDEESVIMGDALASRSEIRRDE